MSEETRKISDASNRRTAFSALRGPSFFLLIVALLVPCLAILSSFIPDVVHDNIKVKKPTRTHVMDSLNSTSVSSAETDDSSFLRSIADKWGLTSPESVSLLKQHLHYNISYDEDKDFLYFFHPLKTGGTSFSFVLRQAIGNVFPGSHPSGFFNGIVAAEGIRREKKRGTYKSWSQGLQVLYSHSSFIEAGRKPKGVAGKVVLSTITQRRIRLMTMVRDPMNHVASYMAEGMCTLFASLRTYNSQQGLPQDTCSNVSLSTLTDIRVDKIKKECLTDKQTYDAKLKHLCTMLDEGQDLYPHCRSVSFLLNTTKLHNQTQLLMGGYRRNDAENEANNGTLPLTKEEVEIHTLQDLGGLNPSLDQAGEFAYIWFGITERMEESMCLFFYTFRRPPFEIPKHRVKPCRPTELWWTERDQKAIQEREALDYVVYRAANAILDVRLAKMRNEIQGRLDQGEDLENILYVAPGCFPKQS